MIKSKIKDIVGLSYIRCLTKEEFGKILELCESELSIDEWDIFDTYTIYDDTKDETYKAFKGVDEILASDVIKEFNNKMKKENFIKTYENNFIRCVSKEEFNEILTIFEKQLNSNRWELFAHYTLYNPVADNCLKLIGDKEYYDAKYIIDEYNGVGFLFEDGERISKDIEKNVENGLLEILGDIKVLKDDNYEMLNSIEDISKKSLVKIEDYIKDSFEKTKDKFEKVGDHTPSINGIKSLKEQFDKLIETQKWDKQEELLTQMNEYSNGDNDCIKKMNEVYPTLLIEFQKNQRLCLELFCKKMLDYGISNIASGTNLSNDDEIRFALSGIWFRINDKIQRFKNLLFFKKGNDVEEPLQDTFLDISNYGIISKLVKDGNWKA